MKRLVAVAASGILTLTACENAVQPVGEGPEIVGQPNVAITNSGDAYGFVDQFFSFLKPLVDDPQVNGNTLNTNLLPYIELWVDSQVVKEAMDVPHACVGADNPSGGQYAPVAVFTPEVNVDGTAYAYGWKTSAEPAGGVAEGVTYRLCVKVQLAGGEQLAGWRTVQPDKTTDPNSPPGAPYLFQAGRTIPIEFWISSKSLCLEQGVLDCTVATFNSNGGTAPCDNPQCGVYVPQGLLEEGQYVTFEIQYVECPVYNTDASGDTISVEYLDIDNPQYYGCLHVTSYANFAGWQGFQGGSTDGIVIAACRDTEIPLIEDERVLMHLESLDDTDNDQRLDVYALPTRPFDLTCDQSQTLGADASLGEKLRFYARQGARTLFPFLDPPELTAAHAGFGAGDGGGLGGGGSDAALVMPATQTASLVTGPVTAGEEMSAVYEYRAVWALPTKIAERLRVDENGDLVEPPTGGAWVDPVSAAAGESLYPAVRLTDDCVAESSTVTDEFGNVITINEPCTESDGSARIPRPVAGATVTFRREDGSVIGTGVSGANGIAWPGSPWTLPTAGQYLATANGLGIGVDPSLASVTLSPPPAVGAYQDHIGNTSVLLRAPKVKFLATVCSDKSFLLDQGVDAADYDGSVTIPLSLSGSESDEAYLYWATDCYRTYFAFVVPQAPDFSNTLRMVFVDDLDTRFGFDPTDPAQFSAVPEVGDDLWLIERDADRKSPTYLQWLVRDYHVANDCTGSSKQSECGRSDVSAGHTNDLVPGNAGGAYVLNGATVYEFARVFPADPSQADSYDFTLPDIGESEWIAFYLTSNRGNAPQADLEYPDFRVFLPIQITRQ